MLTLLTIVCTVGGYAQEKVILDFSKADWSFPEKANANKVSYTCNDGYTITFGANSGHHKQGDGILMGKQGATLSLPAFDFDVEKIIIRKNTGGGTLSSKVTFNIFVDNTTVSTQAKGCDKDNTFIIKDGFQKAGNIYTIKVTSTQNLQTSAIEIYKKAATTPATTTTFGTDSRKTFTFTNGTLEGFTTPTATATKSDDNTDLSDLIEYTSSDADIVTVNSKTGELTFTNTKFGEATITATLPKTDTYQTSTDSYVVENKDNHIPTSLSFNGTDVTLTEGKTDAGADFTGYTATEANNIAGTITYAASGDAVATVDPTTGAVTINPSVYGTTTITATFTPADPTQYSGSTAKYQITNKANYAFYESFDKCNSTGGNDNKWSGQIATRTPIYDNQSWQKSGTVNGANKCIKIGTSSTISSVTTPSITLTTGAGTLSFKAGAWENDKESINVKISNGTLSYNGSETQTISINLANAAWTDFSDIEISATGAFTITFEGTGKNNRFFIDEVIIKTIKAKPAPALSFAEATVTKELVAGTIDLQTITKPEDLDASAITYASSDDATAKVEGNTIRLYKTGEVTITATSAATDKYAAGTASYKLVIEDHRTTDADFKFAAESYNADLAEATDGIVTFNAVDVLQNPNNLKVTYTISPESANATIGKADGKALIKVSGTYTITATGAANDTYKETTATCTLKVTNSAVEETSIEFVAGVDKGKNSTSTTGDAVEKGCVMISSDKAALGRDADYRFYSSTHTISTKIGKITKIEFVGNNIINDKISNPLTNLTSADNNYTCTDPNNGVWVGSAKEVVFTNSSQARATKIIVTVEVPKAKNYTLDETKTDNVIETYENANVTLQRTLSKDYWNTFCVPFALDAEQVAQYFGEGTQLRTYEGNCNNNIVYFATVDNIEAGKPYIMKPGNAVVKNPTFEGVSMVATGLDENGNPQAVGDASTVQMKGIYNQILLKTDKTELFLGDNDLFYYPIDDIDARTIGGLRAYFIVPQGTDIKKLRANLDGTPTSLGTIFDTEESNAPVYNLQGQCVGNSLRALKSGIYIQNGKKVVVK